MLKFISFIDKLKVCNEDILIMNSLTVKAWIDLLIKNKTLIVLPMHLYICCCQN